MLRARTAWSALALVTLLGFVLRVPTIAEPLGIDQGLLASGAKALSRGFLMYRDFWDQKPPAIFLTYLGAFTVFGWTPGSVAWLDLVASALTMSIVFAIVRRLSGVTAAWMAAALYSALTIPAWLYPPRNGGGFLERSVAETFITVAVAAAAWCTLRLRGRASSLGWAGGLGLFAGAAIAYKPNAGLYLPALLVWLAFYRERPSRMMSVVVASGLAAAIIPGATLLWLWHLGVLSEARVALIDFNRFYVGQNFSPGSFAVAFSKAVWLRMKTDPLWSAGGLASVAAAWDLVRTKRLDPLPALAIAWGGAAALVIAVNGVWLFNTYFIQALAPLAVLAAWLLAVAARRPQVHKPAAIVALGLMVFFLARRNYPAKVFDVARADLNQLLGRGDRTTYLERFGGYATNRGYSARANDELAAYLRQRTAPDDRIYQFGINAAGVYFDADRLMAQRFLRVNEFVPSTFPAPGFQIAAVTRELASARPAYLIFEQLHSTTDMGRAVDALQSDPDVQRLLDMYQFDTRIEDFTLYRRRGR